MTATVSLVAKMPRVRAWVNALVRATAVVERHGGRIEGQGVRGEGAEFRFDFGPESGLS